MLALVINAFNYLQQQCFPIYTKKRSRQVFIYSDMPMFAIVLRCKRGEISNTFGNAFYNNMIFLTVSVFPGPHEQFVLKMR